MAIKDSKLTDGFSLAILFGGDTSSPGRENSLKDDRIWVNNSPRIYLDTMQYGNSAIINTLTR